MDRFFGLNKAPKENEEIALLTTVHDEIEKNLLCGMLEEEGIPYSCKDRGAGEVNRIFFGYSMYDCDIMVPRALLEQAEALLEAYNNAESFADDEIVTDPDEEGEEA